MPTPFAIAPADWAGFGWFVDPWLFIATTSRVVAIPHRRDFRSATVRLLSETKG